MSSTNFDSLRSRVLADGETLGWPTLGERIGVDKETLRVFATTPGRGMHGGNWERVQAFYAGATAQLTSRDAAEVAEVLRLLRRAVETQELVLARLQQQPSAKSPQVTPEQETAELETLRKRRQGKKPGSDEEPPLPRAKGGRR